MEARIELYILYEIFSTDKSIIAASPNRDMIETMFKTSDRGRPLELSKILYGSRTGEAEEIRIAYTTGRGDDIIWYWQ